MSQDGHGAAMSTPSSETRSAATVADTQSPEEQDMTRFRNVALATLLGGALVSGAVLAQAQNQGQPQTQAQGERPQGGRRGGGPGFGRGGDFAAGLPLRQLNLTEAQQTQIRALREQYEAQVQPLQERLRADIQALLTPEQQQVITKLNAEREARRQRQAQ
jgi:Spy/CpxP family protein refolding chaperone